LKALESSNADNKLSHQAKSDLDEGVLLDMSQDEFQLYRDQLALAERHLDNLVKDTSRALDLLANLSASFKAVETQTITFQTQGEDVLIEQERLKELEGEEGTDLRYYSDL